MRARIVGSPRSSRTPRCASVQPSKPGDEIDHRRRRSPPAPSRRRAALAASGTAALAGGRRARRSPASRRSPPGRRSRARREQRNACPDGSYRASRRAQSVPGALPAAGARRTSLNAPAFPVTPPPCVLRCPFDGLLSVVVKEGARLKSTVGRSRDPPTASLTRHGWAQRLVTESPSTPKEKVMRTVPRGSRLLKTFLSVAAVGLAASISGCSATAMHPGTPKPPPRARRLLRTDGTACAGTAGCAMGTGTPAVFVRRYPALQPWLRVVVCWSEPFPCRLSGRDHLAPSWNDVP